MIISCLTEPDTVTKPNINPERWPQFSPKNYLNGRQQFHIRRLFSSMMKANQYFEQGKKWLEFSVFSFRWNEQNCIKKSFIWFKCFIFNILKILMFRMSNVLFSCFVHFCPTNILNRILGILQTVKIKQYIFKTE
jgi:hypothetical protein